MSGVLLLNVTAKPELAAPLNDLLTPTIRDGTVPNVIVCKINWDSSNSNSISIGVMLIPPGNGVTVIAVDALLVKLALLAVAVQE
jgi:hypothetical protein